MNASPPPPSRPEATVVELSGTPPWFADLVERARATDGQPPFSDGSLVELATGGRTILAIDESAIALVAGQEAEFVVDPDARGAGLGTAMLAELVRRCDGELLLWAHGDHPAARILARRNGLEPMRTLLHLRGPVPPAASFDGGTVAFRPGIDDAEWLALNAAVFADHPEQGKLKQADLDELLREPWFSANDFLLLRGDNGDLAGYCWLKVEADPGGELLGEFYAVGVSPDRQGEGLGRRLVTAGMARLAEQGIRIAHLYVEADNIPAVRLYRSLGFTDHTIDVQYARRTDAAAIRP